MLSGLAGTTERERTDCVSSHDLFCPSFWDQLDNEFLEYSTQEEQTPGPRQGHLQKPMGENLGSSCLG